MTKKEEESLRREIVKELKPFLEKKLEFAKNNTNLKRKLKKL